jgi:hypothetical protein
MAICVISFFASCNPSWFSNLKMGKIKLRRMNGKRNRNNVKNIDFTTADLKKLLPLCGEKYIILNNFFTLDENANAALINAANLMHLNGDPISEGRKVKIDRRFMLPISTIPSHLKSSLDELERVFKALDGAYSVMDAVYIKSYAGCPKQDLHIDFPELEYIHILADQRLPYSGLIALEDSTFLDVHVGKGRDKISIPIGSCLLMRGDVAHGGCEYKEPNMRLHFHVQIAKEGETKKKKVRQLLWVKTNGKENARHHKFSKVEE